MGSRSNSNQTTNFEIDASIEDRSLNLGEGSDATGANISTVEGIGNNVVNNSVDDAVLAATLDGAGAITDDVLEYSAGVTQASNDIVAAAGGAVVDTTNNALEFAGDTNNSIIENVDNVLAYSAGATQLATSSADASRDKALYIVGAAGEAVVESERKSREDTRRFASEVVEGTREFSAGAISEISNANKRALDAASAASKRAIESGNKAFDAAYEFTGGAFNSALDAVLESTYLTSNKLANATTETINTVSKAATSENQQSLDKVIKLAGVVMAGIAAVSVLPRFIK